MRIDKCSTKKQKTSGAAGGRQETTLTVLVIVLVLLAVMASAIVLEVLRYKDSREGLLAYVYLPHAPLGAK